MERLSVIPVLFALLTGATAAPAAHAAQVVTIDSNLVVRVRLGPHYRIAPRASVILLAGGNGVLNLNGQGDTRDLQGNFLLRSVRFFLARRLNVALLDAEPARPAPNGLNNQRLTAAHALHLGEVIAAVRRQWPGKPVWLVGTSNGTLSALNAAARLRAVVAPDRRALANVVLPGADSAPNGLVLTSSVTRPDPNGETGTVLGQDPSLASVAIPTLVMWHQNDTCSLSPASAAKSVFIGLTGLPAGKKAHEVISGGLANIAVHACSAFGPHGYHEVEERAVAAIAKFIAVQSAAP
jgi:pimeloyl-ACP methyl ester carboxylesterase